METEGTVGEDVVDFDLTEDYWVESQSVSEEPEVLLVNKARLPPTNNQSTPGEYLKYCYSIVLILVASSSTPTNSNVVPASSIDINLRDLPLINFWQSVFKHDSYLDDIAKKFAQHGLSQEDLKDIDDFVISRITDNLKIHIKVRKAIQ